MGNAEAEEVLSEIHRREPGWKCNTLAWDLFLLLKCRVERRDEAGAEPGWAGTQLRAPSTRRVYWKLLNHSPWNLGSNANLVALLCSSGVQRSSTCLPFNTNGKIGCVKSERLFYSRYARWCHEQTAESNAPGESQHSICREVPACERWWEAELDWCFCFIGIGE